MARRTVLGNANRDVGRFTALSMRLSNPSISQLRYTTDMSTADRANTANTLSFSLFGSFDNFSTRTFLGAVSGWQGGTEEPKGGGQPQPKPPPGITIEVTEPLRGIEIVCEVDVGNSMQFSMDAEDF